MIFFVVIPHKLLQGRNASGPVYRSVDAILAGPFADELTAQRALIGGRFPKRARVQGYQVTTVSRQSRYKTIWDRMLGR